MRLATRTDTGTSKEPHDMRLLIVDDDPDITGSLKDLFETENLSIDVITASSEAEARRIAETVPIDIAVLDIRLGQKNGLDLVPLLKQRNKYIVCLMMTAYRDVQFAVSAIRFGADDYLFKPLEPTHILGTIKRCIKYQNYRRQLDRAESWFRTIFETSDHLMFVSDLNGSLYQINNKASEFCGVVVDDISGKKIWGLQPWQADRRAAAKMRNAFMAADSNSRSSVEVAMETSGNQKKVLEFTVRPLAGGPHNQDYMLVEGRDITDSRRKEENLKLEACHDELTGLANRGQLLDALRSRMAASIRHDRKLSLLFIDLDLFKEVNDRFGHDFGDKVLKKVSERLGRCIRSEDLVARYSGDEFIVLLNETDDLLGAQLVAERVREELSKELTADGIVTSISCSIGIAMYPDHATEPEQLVRLADEAMYCAKREGRNRYCVAT